MLVHFGPKDGHVVQIFGLELQRVSGDATHKALHGTLSHQDPTIGFLTGRRPTVESYLGVAPVGPRQISGSPTPASVELVGLSCSLLPKLVVYSSISFCTDTDRALYRTLPPSESTKAQGSLENVANRDPVEINEASNSSANALTAVRPISAASTRGLNSLYGSRSSAAKASQKISPGGRRAKLQLGCE